VQNNEVKLNHGYGVRVGYGTQILNNYVHDNGQTGIGGGIGTTTAPTTESMNSNVLIQGNVVNHNDYAHFSAGFGSGGIKTGGTSGIVMRGNTVQHNEGSGIHFDMNSQNELVDGNTITDNTDADGLVQEIGFGTSTFRNNVVLRNGAQVNATNIAFQIDSRASSGVTAYCNVMEVSSGAGINGWAIGASNRGNSAYPPFQYLVTTGSSVHHNTVIWDAGAAGSVGYLQNDAANQPNFFASNTPPDYNSYHLVSASAAAFIYDNNDTQRNTLQTFPNYQGAGADVHGTVDTNYTNGFPAVSITSPKDQASVTTPVTIRASASDGSGISKVEFFVDWVLQATATGSPYNFNWANATAGSHTVAAMAYSNAGISVCYAVTLNVQ
jgi:parallel beta-helix repeat protein